MGINKELIEFFTPESPLKEIWPQFEFRAEQKSMAAAVAEAYHSSAILLVEAGTGVGKTLAYLLPLVASDREENERIAVSTETRALQKQLIESDLPLLEKVLGRKVKAAVCYGSNNYLCLRKYHRVLQNGDFDRKMEPHLSDFNQWVDSTVEGNRFDYNGFVTDEFWRKVSRDSDSCFGKRCPYFSDSYYFKARRNWKTSELLILNHSLLSTNMAMDGQLLPEIKSIVIDEAHNFPEIFLNAFIDSTTISEIERISLEGESKIGALQSEIDNFRSEISALLGRSESASRRLKSELKSEVGDNLIEHLNKKAATLKQLLAQEQEQLFGEIPEELSNEELEWRRNNENLLLRINKVKEIISSFLSGPEEESVHWITRYKLKNNEVYELAMAPITVGEIIREKLLELYCSVIFTSATICTAGREPFNYFLKEIGFLTDSEQALEKELLTLQLKSPFDYARQSLLYLPARISDPSRDEKEFHADCSREIIRLVNLSQGGALLLFTSRRSLQAIRELMEKSPELNSDLNFFDQDELGPGAAYRAFKDSKSGVLLGLNSFWQGIDLPGLGLRMVIVVRLPFQAPERPILDARLEKERLTGLNPFKSIQLPQAIIQLKQGFGRLIRSGDDRGVVAILDPRIQSKFYGRDVLNALPPARRVSDFSQLELGYQEIIGKDFEPHI